MNVPKSIKIGGRQYNIVPKSKDLPQGGIRRGNAGAQVDFNELLNSLGKGDARKLRKFVHSHGCVQLAATSRVAA